MTILSEYNKLELTATISYKWDTRNTRCHLFIYSLIQKWMYWGKKLCCSKVTRTMWWIHFSVLLVISIIYFLKICLPKLICEIGKTTWEEESSPKPSHYCPENELISHYLYGPDLSPKDIFFYPLVKNRKRDQHFTTVKAYKQQDLGTPRCEWKNDMHLIWEYGNSMNTMLKKNIMNNTYVHSSNLSV